MEVVKAGIIIHPDANRTLARVAIAHEIFHLLLELKQYLETGRQRWIPVEVTRAIEDECNQFAWELCHMHDRFNKDARSTSAMIHFPENFFNAPISTNSDRQAQWPDGMALDPTARFFEKVIGY
jgi:hypothetical protein